MRPTSPPTALYCAIVTFLPVDIEVTCYAYEGIDAIKAALKAGQAVSSEELSVQVRKHSTGVVRLGSRLSSNQLTEACTRST